MTDQTKFDSIDDIDAEGIIHGEQTAGNYEGVQHCLLTDEDGYVVGRWMDDGDDQSERFKPKTVAPSTINRMQEHGQIADDCKVHRIDFGSCAPWTWVEKEGLRPPRPGASTGTSTGTIDLTTVKGISDKIAGRVRESVDVEKLQTSAEIDPTFVDRSVLTAVKGISEKRAGAIVDYLADPSNFNGGAGSTGGANLSEDERADRVREQILDGASPEDVVTCIPDCEKRDLRNAQDDMSAPELKKHKGTLKDAIALVS